MVKLLGKLRPKPSRRICSLIIKKSSSSNIFCWPCHSCQIIDINALNVYQLNIYQNLILLYKAPSRFFNKFSKINHNYPTSSKNSCKYGVPKSTIKLTSFAISRRDRIPWNTVLDATLKKIKYLPPFKAKVKEMSLSRDNQLLCF